MNDFPIPKFVIMAGGRASRMGRGVFSVDRTKGLMKIPARSGSDQIEETIIDRTLRLLGMIESFNEDEVLMCVGYKEELVKNAYPECQYLTTYDPDDPDDLCPALLRLVEASPNNERLIILLGDVVWSLNALSHFLENKDAGPLVFYHGKDPYYKDIFGIVINGNEGKALIRLVNKQTNLPVIKGEIRWHGKEVVPIRNCRASTIEQWIDLNKIPGKVRVYQKGSVDDVDWDRDHEKICKQIKAGDFG